MAISLADFKQAFQTQKTTNVPGPSNRAAPPFPKVSPARQAAKSKSQRRRLRTGVYMAPSLDKVRAGLEAWAARTLSKSRAPFLINLSNYREMHQDASVLEMHGAEILADVTVGAGGDVALQFHWDPKAQPPQADKYWTPDAGNVPVIIEIVDGKTGVPVKGARVRFNDGRSAVTDTKGKARVEAPVDSQWNVEVSAPGYRNAQQRITVGSQGIGGEEHALRLAPLDPKTVDKVVLGITIVDITSSAKVQKAKVTISKLDKQPFLTDADGFTIAYLLPGVYSFKVEARGFVSETGSLDVPESKEQEFQIIGLKPSGAEDVFVRVLDATTGSPIAKVSVRLGTQHELTDSHGEVRFGSVPFGEHRLWANIDGYGVYDKTVVHGKAGATKFHELKLQPKLM